MGEKLRTPLTYWGGKQMMAGRIIKLLPEPLEDWGYVEPFCGGAAVFWAKPPSKWEVINDTNREIINFYEQVKNDFVSLEKMVRISLHSREHFCDAKHVYKRPAMFPPLKRAWAVWMLANTAFCGDLHNSFGYSRSDQASKRLANKRDSFTEGLAIRLQNVQIEACDALRIIRSRDTEKTLFYCDPPYIDSDQGHYDGYGKNDYESLLEELSWIKGKFLLSSYRSEPLRLAVAAHGWHSIEIRMPKVVSKGNTKVEVLTANYPIHL
ncbi:MAG: DNA adenine methylase [Spirochaetota bacterium]